MSAAAPPWEDLPAGGVPDHDSGRPGQIVEAEPPHQEIRAVALAMPVAGAEVSIDEMLEMMAKQVDQVLKWTQAEGFSEAYRTASANARGLFQTAALNLYKRAGQLRGG